MLNCPVIYAQTSYKICGRDRVSHTSFIMWLNCLVFMALLYFRNTECLGGRGKILYPFGYCLSLAFSLCLLQETHRLV
jgi:hypothetical protein